MKAGDQVQLKSGGPVMTVEFISTTTNEIHCMWFDEKGVLKQAQFPEAVLKPYTDDDDEALGAGMRG